MVTLSQRAVALSNNLWWSWQPGGASLWSRLGGSTMWRESASNPKKLIELLGPNLKMNLERVSEPLIALHDQFTAYLAESQTWHDRIGAPCEGGVAYFSAEYGLHESVVIYSGGLGILAGDHVKSASDLGVPFTAVGLLYRHGYVQQRVDAEGRQRAEFDTFDFNDYPLHPATVDHERLVVEVPIFGEVCRCAVWTLHVGRVRLLLLDTDLEQNTRAHREITAKLYGGDEVTRIQQELVLGVGGIRALRALKVEPSVYHLNEGHSSFLSLERLREEVSAGRSIDEAFALIRSSSVFTTHTPVEAGHDRFDVELAWRALSWVGEALSLTREQLIALGHWPDERDPNALFNMTLLAMNCCAHLNGVAALHGQVSREMFSRFWPERSIEEVPIGHVTNGVHAPTWQAHEIRALLNAQLGGAGAERTPEEPAWAQTNTLSDEVLWECRRALRGRLIDLGREREATRRARYGLSRWEDKLDPDALTIGFARRFATYKRANLIFSEMERLLQILSDAPGPVQLFFAGKAHPADEGGQALIKAVYDASQHPALRGRVLLIEDYDMEVGRVMVQGADVWLNNPRRPKEASGTSGMKVAMNGGLNLSILDGWWPEGFNDENGWAIGDPKTYSDIHLQDREDARSLYQCLESEVIPTFFDRDERDLPTRWLQMSKEAIASCTPQFHSHRQVRDYVRTLYTPAHKETR